MRRSVPDRVRRMELEGCGGWFSWGMKRRDVRVPRRKASARGSDGSDGREPVFEEVDGGDEVTLPDGHD